MIATFIIHAKAIMNRNLYSALDVRVWFALFLSLSQAIWAHVCKHNMKSHALCKVMYMYTCIHVVAVDDCIAQQQHTRTHTHTHTHTHTYTHVHTYTHTYTRDACRMFFRAGSNFVIPPPYVKTGLRGTSMWKLVEKTQCPSHYTLILFPTALTADYCERVHGALYRSLIGYNTCT